MTLRLRTAGINDAELLSRLGARLFEQAFGPDNTADDMAAYLADAFTPERQAAELAEADRITWIAEDDSGNAVGYAVLIRGAMVKEVEGRRAAELRRIYVDRTLHGRPIDGEGRGAGALLVDQCVAQARVWECDAIWLAVWERNARAIRFYEKHGFQKMGRTDFRLGSDVQHDFVMARNL
jgi:ribosomal protein S18 acetylase RimI-like enzyme